MDIPLLARTGAWSGGQLDFDWNTAWQSQPPLAEVVVSRIGEDLQTVHTPSILSVGPAVSPPVVLDLDVDLVSDDFLVEVGELEGGDSLSSNQHGSLAGEGNSLPSSLNGDGTEGNQVVQATGRSEFDEVLGAAIFRRRPGVQVQGASSGVLGGAVAHVRALAAIGTAREAVAGVERPIATSARVSSVGAFRVANGFLEINVSTTMVADGVFVLSVGSEHARNSGDDHVGATTLVFTTIGVEIDMAKGLLGTDTAKQQGSSVAVDDIDEVGIAGGQVGLISVRLQVGEEGSSRVETSDTANFEVEVLEPSCSQARNLSSQAETDKVDILRVGTTLVHLVDERADHATDDFGVNGSTDVVQAFGTLLPVDGNDVHGFPIKISILDSFDPIMVSRFAEAVGKEFDGKAGIEVGSVQGSIAEVGDDLRSISVVASVQKELSFKPVRGSR